MNLVQCFLHLVTTSGKTDRDIWPVPEYVPASSHMHMHASNQKSISIGSWTFVIKMEMFLLPRLATITDDDIFSVHQRYRQRHTVLVG